MNELIREFLAWSIGFVIVSAMALLAGHLLARRARKNRTVDETSGVDATNAPKRGPAWGSALIVVIAYLCLLGPVLQGVSRTLRSEPTAESSGSAAESTAHPNVNRPVSAMLSVPVEGLESVGDSADCPCRKKQPKAVEDSAESIEEQQDSGTIGSRGLVKSK